MILGVNSNIAGLLLSMKQAVHFCNNISLFKIEGTMQIFNPFVIIGSQKLLKYNLPSPFFAQRVDGILPCSYFQIVDFKIITNIALLQYTFSCFERTT